MDLPFDTKKEEAKLAEVREREEEDIARILSEKYGLTYTDLALVPINADALRTIPEEKAKEAEAAAFERSGKHLSVATANPSNPHVASLLADLAAREFVVKQFLISKRSLAKALSRYADLSYAVETKAGVFAIGSAKEAHPLASIAALKEALDAALATKQLDRAAHLLEAIVVAALTLKASDIHLEPEETLVRLRFRLDGQLTDVFHFSPDVFAELNSRIKLLSGVKLNVADRAQDGRFSISQSDGDIEVRSSFIPGNYGEAVVLRLLDPTTTQHSFKELGIHPKLLKRLETEIRRANGMLLNTGPTGSGKTTTLYAFLREIHTPEIKIITIEDPVEYHLAGIVQTQVEAKKYTFAEGLRSIVRQDPDVIMVGEIRDAETANIAIEAALTGHYVFSTLHTNNAAGTFPRLADLGADPKSFGSAITVSMAQRLVRTLDPEHRKERAATDAEKNVIKKVLDSIEDKSLLPENTEKLWDAVPEGESNGYKGRIGLYEAIFMDDEMATFLRDNPPENEIAKLALKQGYLTMAQDGILKALTGLTTLEEVGKTVDLPTP